MTCNCKREMQPLVSGMNLSASEFYCHECHRSVRMSEEESRQVLQQQAVMMAAAQQGKGR